MYLTTIIENEKNNVFRQNQYKKNEIKENTLKYSLFSEQYLEEPVVSGDYKMALSPTACTIKNVPAIDDF